MRIAVLWMRCTPSASRVRSGGRVDRNPPGHLVDDRSSGADLHPRPPTGTLPAGWLVGHHRSPLPLKREDDGSRKRCSPYPRRKTSFSRGGLADQAESRPASPESRQYRAEPRRQGPQGRGLAIPVSTATVRIPPRARPQIVTAVAHHRHAARGKPAGGGEGQAHAGTGFCAMTGIVAGDEVEAVGDVRARQDAAAPEPRNHWWPPPAAARAARS
jgi:hypothetical protein